MNDEDKLRRQLVDLLTEHRDLDEATRRMADDPTANPLQIQRLKKRKLALKDQIATVKSRILPDIIA